MFSGTTPIREHMVTHTVQIDADLPLADAKARMASEKIRHLPVFDGDRLIGILSARDIVEMESMDGIVPAETPVGTAMEGTLKTVSPDTPMSEVMTLMVEKHIGAVPVVENDKLVGIFTTVDACKLLLRAMV